MNAFGWVKKEWVYRPRVCQNSFEHGRVRSDDLLVEPRGDFVLLSAAKAPLLRKVFSSNSQNLSFDTAAALTGRASSRNAAEPHVQRQSFSHTAENSSHYGEPFIGVARSREGLETGFACDGAGYEILTLPRLKQSDEFKDQTC